MSPDSAKPIPSRRTVCDHCRRRRIRCDGEFPCNQCSNASLSCKREHVPKRRGPKRGSGRVINELRAHDGDDVRPPTKARSNGSPGNGSGSQSTGPGSIDQWITDSVDASTSPTTGQSTWHPIIVDLPNPLTEEPNSIFTTDQFRPTSRSYFNLIPTCIDLFYEHIYPIMPLIYMPALREAVDRPLKMHEKNLLYSLCALTSTHMSGKSIQAPGPPSWEAAGRFFLDECILVRQAYDFVEDKSLWAVISSYLVSIAFFEINQNRKSWYYLREAMTMGQDLGLHDENSYVGLSPAEQLCRRRTFWILYVTERSFAILRHKPLTLSKTPGFPATVHEYENLEIHSGFMRLVQSYHLLDSSFVDCWNEASEAPASTLAYTALQRQLNLPHPSHVSLTDIQKADILVTQQWLRLIVWQSSMRQGLLSSTAEDESMTFRYPLKIAHSLLNVISTLPTSSIEVHGMGIFEKIFEVGNTMLDVMQACGTNIPHENYGVVQDPFDMFVKTLSQTPNSQRQYANLLLAKAAEKPEIQRFSQTLVPALSNNGLPGPMTGVDFGSVVGGLDGAGNVGEVGAPFINPDGLMAPVPARQWRGSIVGEITEDDVYKVEEDGTDEPCAEWNDNTVWVTDSNDGDSVVGGTVWLS